MKIWKRKWSERGGGEAVVGEKQGGKAEGVFGGISERGRGSGSLNERCWWGHVPNSINLLLLLSSSSCICNL